MKHTTFTFFFLSLLGFSVQKGFSQMQNQCGTGIPSQQWETELQKWISHSQQAGKSSAATAYVIPVVVHVIHGGQSVGSYPNIAQGQIKSQIQVLNEDFGGVGYNSGTYPGSAFTTWASNQGLTTFNLDGLNRVRIANCNVQFCLATTDTSGNPLTEPGIDRVNYVSKGWTNPGSPTSISTFKTLMDNTIKPGTIWNPTKYFNIWVTDINLNATGLLGYATFPPSSGLSGIPSGVSGTPTTDGVWCYARAFGSVAGYPSGSYSTGNDRGRTLTHEVGHWLGLRHIWGDGDCFASDYCNDTPPASDKNFGNPSYPLKTTTCSGNSPNGEMFMNFMDYVDDKSKYMFTPDQAVRVQASMANSPYRKFLGTHNLCSVATVPATSQFGMVTQTCGVGVPVVLSNNATGVPVPSYTWVSNGGATFFPDAFSQAVTVTFPAAGTYTVMLTTNNGTASSTSKIINVYDYPNLLLTTGGISDTVCLNDQVNITASGGNSYVWTPGSLSGSVVSYVATSDKSYTVIAFGTGNCKTTGSIYVTVSECTGLTNNSFAAPFVNVYPNPANSSVTIELQGEVNPTKVQITDITGKEIINRTADKQTVVDMQQLPSGIYILKVSADNGHQQIIKLVKE
jgi:hypothetical protein